MYKVQIQQLSFLPIKTSNNLDFVNIISKIIFCIKLKEWLNHMNNANLTT